MGRYYKLRSTEQIFHTQILISRLPDFSALLLPFFFRWRLLSSSILHVLQTKFIMLLMAIQHALDFVCLFHTKNMYISFRTCKDSAELFSGKNIICRVFSYSFVFRRDC